MVEITTDVVGDDGKFSKGQYKSGLSKGVRDALATLQHVHKTEVIRRGGGAPVLGVWTTRKGEARRSFHIDQKPGAVEGAYGSRLFRIRMMEMGGEIVPRQKLALRFKTYDGQWHTVKSVFMPARPTLGNALRRGQTRMDEAMARRTDKGLDNG